MAKGCLSTAEADHALAAEITMFDEVGVVYKFIGDLMFLFGAGCSKTDDCG